MIETIEEIKEITQIENQTLPLSLRALDRLVWNYWWSWSAEGPSVFRDLDPELWEECEHNPLLLLAKISEYRLAQMATDPVYIDRVRRLNVAPPAGNFQTSRRAGPPTSTFSAPPPTCRP